MKVFASWRCVVEEDNKLLEAFADNITNFKGDHGKCHESGTLKWCKLINGMCQHFTENRLMQTLHPSVNCVADHFDYFINLQ